VPYLGTEAAIDIFSSVPGAVTVLDSPGIPMALFIDSWGGYSFFKSIITGVQLQTKSGVQYVHTLRDLIYVYTFGERVSVMQIVGVSFASQCENLQDQLGQPNHGIEFAYAYYLNNRVATRGSPVQIVIGLSSLFFGFLDGAQFSVMDPERLLGQFSLGFTCIPQPSLLDLLLG
jgi:hypothetical protein